MRCLLVHAHPLDKSLTRHFLDTARVTLERAGHSVEVLDLYPAKFDPRLTASERASYYAPAFDRSGLDAEATQLESAEILVLVFPTWWFGLPAILKGWVDRVFAPGVAFDHGKYFGPIVPRLNRLQRVMAITTLGSPWWVDWIAMRRPVRRVLKTAIIGTCAPKARFTYFPFYAAEAPGRDRIARFSQRIAKELTQI